MDFHDPTCYTDLSVMTVRGTSSLELAFSYIALPLISTEGLCLDMAVSSISIVNFLTAVP